MTKDEFEIEHLRLLDQVPEAFRGWLSYHAWREGHAYGYVEVLGYLEDLVDGFLVAINQWQCPKCGGGVSG